jgi:hypothetical protein
MVQPAENALQCRDCHTPQGRIDWEALGYPGDPADWGSRDLRPTSDGATANRGPVGGSDQGGVR